MREQWRQAVGGAGRAELDEGAHRVFERDRHDGNAEGVIKTVPVAQLIQLLAGKRVACLQVRGRHEAPLYVPSGLRLPQRADVRVRRRQGVRRGRYRRRINLWVSNRHRRRAAHRAGQAAAGAELRPEGPRRATFFGLCVLSARSPCEEEEGEDDEEGEVSDSEPRWLLAEIPSPARCSEVQVCSLFCAMCAPPRPSHGRHGREGGACWQGWPHRGGMRAHVRAKGGEGRPKARARPTAGC